MKHPRIQQYLVKKKEEQEKFKEEQGKNKEAELLAKKKAAEKGSVEACISLAHYYELEWSRNGYQEEYIRESVYWLQQAAKKKDAKAIEQLVKTLTETLCYWEYPWKKEIMSDCYYLSKVTK